jgi:hypothetical protein
MIYMVVWLAASGTQGLHETVELACTDQLTVEESDKGGQFDWFRWFTWVSFACGLQSLQAMVEVRRP